MAHGLKMFKQMCDGVQIYALGLFAHVATNTISFNMQTFYVDRRPGKQKVMYISLIKNLKKKVIPKLMKIKLIQI